MYSHLVNPYYSDTDSLFIDKPLDSSLIGKELGKFKQEYNGVINNALFISPKLYLLELENKNIVKSKGYSGDLTKLDFINLYNDGILHLENER